MTTLPSDQPTSNRSLARSNIIGWGVLSVTIGVVVAAFVGRMAPELFGLFVGFGADVPASTRFVLGWWGLLWVMPVLALVVCVGALRRPDEPRLPNPAIVALAALAALTIALGALAMFALYDPIFAMGQTV